MIKPEKKLELKDIEVIKQAFKQAGLENLGIEGDNVVLVFNIESLIESFINYIKHANMSTNVETTHEIDWIQRKLTIKIRTKDVLTIFGVK